MNAVVTILFKDYRHTTYFKNAYGKIGKNL